MAARQLGGDADDVARAGESVSARDAGRCGRHAPRSVHIGTINPDNTVVKGCDSDRSVARVHQLPAHARRCHRRRAAPPGGRRDRASAALVGNRDELATRGRPTGSATRAARSGSSRRPPWPCRPPRSTRLMRMSRNRSGPLPRPAAAASASVDDGRRPGVAELVRAPCRSRTDRGPMPAWRRARRSARSRFPREQRDARASRWPPAGERSGVGGRAAASAWAER